MKPAQSPLQLISRFNSCHAACQSRSTKFPDGDRYLVVFRDKILQRTPKLTKSETKDVADTAVPRIDAMQGGIGHKDRWKYEMTQKLTHMQELKKGAIA